MTLLFIPIVIVVVFMSTTINAFSEIIEHQTGTCSDTGQVQCGANTCLPKGYTCCPDALIGCFTTTAYCYLNSTDTYGCCGLGNTCRDGQGNNTSSRTTSTSHGTSKVTKTSSAASSTTYASIISTSTSVQTLSPYSYHPSTLPTVSIATTTSTAPSSTTAASQGTRRLARGVSSLYWFAFTFLGLFTF
ncbi:hypothetical protein BDZ45DRAFT_298968 [Acephala macrosclerotiorum]|nr:hypothetical protein BDZ45DRAFT_298968 [Acephala macrosclerotiorum]